MKAAAAKGDHVVGIDRHKERSDGHPIVPAPFDGTLTGSLEAKIKLNGQPAARLGSKATGGHEIAYACSHTGTGDVVQGSSRVRFNGHPVARDGDLVKTCQCGGWDDQPKIVVKGRKIWVG